MLEIRLLGQFKVQVNGAEAAITVRPVQALLAYLALNAGVAQPRDRLAGLLWPESSQAAARKNLRRTLWRLRQAIGDAWLPADRQAVTLTAAADCWIDVVALQTAADAETAVAAYGGELLPGFYDDWVLLERERLHAFYERRLQAFLDQLQEAGRWSDALHWAEEWIALGMAPEPAYRVLMRAHAALGDLTAMAAAYRRCEAALASELAVEPSPETAALYEMLKQGVGSGEKRPSSSPAMPPSARSAGPSSDLPAFFEMDKVAPPSRFVARERQLDQLNAALDVALAGQGQVVFVTGGAGSGKSALLNAFVRRALAAHETLVAAGGAGNAHAGGGDPYLPFRDMLALLTGDVMQKWQAGLLQRIQAQRLWQLSTHTHAALTRHGPDLRGAFVSAEGASPHSLAPLQQSALFEQVTRVLLALAQQAPLLLTLDDVQWADAGSLELLFHFGRRLAAGRILLVAAYREDEVALGRQTAVSPGSASQRHPLGTVVNELQRLYGHEMVNLDAAVEVTGRDFISAYLDAEPNELDDAFREALYRHTNGHPLFTVELLRHLQEQGSLKQDARGRWTAVPAIRWNTLPARVEAVIEERLARLSAAQREWLAIASVEGNLFTAQVIAQLQGIDVRRVVHGLSREMDRMHRLITESEQQQVNGQRLYQYRFRHLLYQQHLYHSLGENEQSLLHEDVGLALEAVYGEHASTLASQLAWHFAKAGLADKSMAYSLLAGDRARQLYAHQEAIYHYQQALPPLRQAGDAGQTARTLMKLGLTYHNAFDFQQARRAYEEGFAFWQRAGAGQAAVPQRASQPLRLAALAPLTLDPGRYQDDASAQMIYHLFSGLVELSPEMNVVPDVAASWQVLENGRRTIFRLREDVYWSDGMPVTAVDFEYAWKRILRPGTPERPGNYLYDLLHARAYHQGELSDAAAVGVQTLDDYTLAVTLAEPTSYLPQLLTVATTFPVPRHVVAAHGDAWTSQRHLVTNGAFRLVDWEPGRRAVLERNPAYYGRFSGNVKRIELLFQPDEGSSFRQMMDQGVLDAVSLSLLPAAEQESARQQHAGGYLTGPVLSTTYVGFNVTRPPFADVRVRRALTMAVDRARLAGIAKRGMDFSATGGLVPPGMPGHLRDGGLPFAPDKARALLAQAGYARGDGFPPVTAVFIADPSPQQISQFLQSQWQEHLGIEIAWQAHAWEDVIELLQNRTPDLWILGWSADYPDPDNFLRVSDFRLNGGWRHPQFDQWVAAGRQVTDQRARLDLYRQAEEVLLTEAPIIPLLYKRFHWLLQPWVSQFPTAPVVRNVWKDVVVTAR